ncbi:hypothetical protein NDR87_23620 [Nocardia sp. CDC159]|uniref:Uncharacterized protein n=1 Tax=Nocardia pulmonis TaxID=2951408 RepID=A0A9X2ECN4_9NOCA|nr:MULTISPECIES: hypothetical protein [Nocardia]MCM6776940.1 hypothetical protein [Nocardia pulmonis]MCM6789364.1 hypothetical protein [Nocardia sp. CDC159]
MRVEILPIALLAAVALTASACGSSSPNPLGLTPTPETAASDAAQHDRAAQPGRTDCGQDDAGYQFYALTARGPAACAHARAALDALDALDAALSRGGDQPADLLITIESVPWTCRSYENEIPPYRECVNQQDPFEKAQRRLPRTPISAPGEPQVVSIACGPADNGLTVHAITGYDDAACATAVPVANAYLRKAEQERDPIITVRVNGVNWDCQERQGNPNPMRECVNGTTPTEKLRLGS